MDGRERPKTGIIVLDKPRGPTSHQVTAWVKEMVGTPAGHSGTLDPMVSGVLVVMLGKAVRLAPLLLNHDKEYICLMRLHGNAPEERVREVAREFTGRIYQRPPRVSAVRRQLRIRRIHEIEILEMQGRLVLFRVRCEAGTYIRSLCVHMGLAIGVGAQMQELRRSRSGPFGESEAYTLHDLRDACTAGEETGDWNRLNALIVPVDRALPGVPRIVIRDTAVDALCHGALLSGVGVLETVPYTKGEMVAVVTGKGELVCLGEALGDSSAYVPGETGLVVAPRTVFMEQGTYPKGWTTHQPRETSA
jgi:H/ACA ribonucleoprotein complex subunit 4